VVICHYLGASVPAILDPLLIHRIPCLLPLLVAGALLAGGRLRAQPNDTLPDYEASPGETSRSFGSTGQSRPFDTSAFLDVQQRAADAAGLLDVPIDPTTYRVGPNDIFTVGLPLVNYRQYDLRVTYDGKLLVPGAGAVDVRGKTLEQASAAIRNACARIYKADVGVALTGMRRFKVFLLGEVRKPGAVVATPVTRVSEVIDGAGGTRVQGSKRRIMIFRGGDTIPVDLSRYLASGDLASNPTVEGGDRIFVGSQDRRSIVGIYGAVNRQGEIDWQRGDSISTVLGTAFGLTAEANRDSILLVRIDAAGRIVTRSIHHARPDGSLIDDAPVEPGDRIYIRSIPNYRKASSVVVAGEVEKPGSYPIISGETRLRDLVYAAGGFTPEAAISDVTLIRRRDLSVTDPRETLIQSIPEEKRTDDDIAYLRQKATQRQRAGVMTVNFTQLMSGDENENIVLEDNDSLYAPHRLAFIRLSGKVKNPGNITYTPGLRYEQYIAMAGGYGWRAEESDTRIIKARNGDEFPASNEGNYTLEPGDQIYVPEEKQSDFWSGVATAITIVAQIGTIVAVVLSISNSSQAKD